jgi:hypothetical protein
MRNSETLTVVSTRFKPRLVVGVMLFSLLSAATMIDQVAQAAVYKKVDAEGNVTFSDVPDKSAQLINVAPLATMPALSQDQIARTLQDDDSSQSTARINYSINIISPTPDQTYHRSVDAFSANVEVKPDMKNGDHLVLLVDGKTSGQDVPADQLDRGQHQLEARVVSKSGRVLKSQSVTFFVQQPNIVRKQPR